MCDKTIEGNRSEERTKAMAANGICADPLATEVGKHSKFFTNAIAIRLQGGNEIDEDELERIKTMGTMGLLMEEEPSGSEIKVIINQNPKNAARVLAGLTPEKIKKALGECGLLS